MPFLTVEFLRKATKRKRPSFIRTDAGPFYITAMKRVFYSNKVGGLRVKHKVINTGKTGKNNVRIETVFMKMRDRVNAFRGLKALWSAPLLMTGIVIQHNFIEEHDSIRDFPSERAGL